MEIKFGDNVLTYEKVGWDINGEVKGLRYGENPGQQAALYRLKEGNIKLGEVETIQSGKYLASDFELLQSGKHPGKTNITDVDNALNILKYFSDEFIVVILKHNNPCGVAIGENLCDAYVKANMADRVAAFGGAIALNRPVDMETAKEIFKNYAEVVVAPDFEEGVLELFSQKKNLRVMRIKNIQRLKEWVGKSMLDFKSLIDGGLIIQSSYVPKARTIEDIKNLPLGYTTKKGVDYQIERSPTEQEIKDLWFGWLVESGVTSNSVLYVKDGVTVGIGTGEQDRVGVAKIARDKAYDKARDRICYLDYGLSYNELILKIDQEKDSEEKNKLELQKQAIEEKVKQNNGGLKGAVMISDAFFPFRDGIDIGLREGVTAVIHPGGSINDHESIIACNERGATMVLTGQRSFKH